MPLSDRRPLALDELLGEDDDSVAYDFDELEPMQRMAIDELFWESGVPHAWDGVSLVVRDTEEEQADLLIDAADSDAFLGSDAPQLSYELDDWDDEHRAQLAEVLATSNIEHAWDEHGELVVLEDDEDRVDALVDAVEHGRATADLALDTGGAADASDADGPDAQEVLSELFVAADRLMHDPLDHEGVLSFVDGVELAESLPLPYGFAPAVWDDIVGQAKELAAAIAADDVDDDDIVEQATKVRATLRQFV
ncbi:MAG: hypothetical protein ACR2LQ_13885 [Acidimicrobiales bacterium]